VLLLNTLHSFLNKLSQQQDISQLLNSNYYQHQATLIDYDLDSIVSNEHLVNKLLTANPLTIITHNTRNISDTTKYTQLLEILTIHKVDICDLTETDHAKGQKYKLVYHPIYCAY